MTKTHGTLKKIAEGKTKIILPDPSNRDCVIIKSKDAITANDGAKKDILSGKKLYSTTTTCNVFEFLKSCGVPTHYIEREGEDTFKASHCDMIPLEVVARRLATGSYLRRYPYVAEGHYFSPPLIEFFLKDDKRHDPVMAPLEILKEKVASNNGKILTKELLDWMASLCQVVFLVLERVWKSREVMLVDLKIEFGFDSEEECVVADVIDNDSWRIWPKGDKSLMKDKQVYRNLQETSKEAFKEELKTIGKNYAWVAEETSYFNSQKDSLCVLLMGSSSDQGHTVEISRILEAHDVPIEQGVLSAHKTPEALLARIHEWEGLGKRLVYIAVAGRSNGLGPVLDGATAFPVINCPPYNEKFSGMDILSSLRLPSGMSAVTVLEPEAAALAAIKILSVDDPLLWGQLKVGAWKRHLRILEEDRKIGGERNGKVKIRIARYR